MAKKKDSHKWQPRGDDGRFQSGKKTTMGTRPQGKPPKRNPYRA